MTDAEVAEVLRAVGRYEGRVPYFYLDNAEPPNVTIGIGCLVPNVDVARRLPMRHALGGAPASPEEIASDFFRVRSMRGGMAARSYRGLLVLADADVDALAAARLRSAALALPRLFQGFETYPAPARLCLLDLAWNCGTGAVLPGLGGWRLLRRACASGRFDVAATECATSNPDKNPQREARNAWRRALFLEAAGLAGPSSVVG